MVRASRRSTSSAHVLGQSCGQAEWTISGGTVGRSLWKCWPAILPGGRRPVESRGAGGRTDIFGFCSPGGWGRLQSWDAAASYFRAAVTSDEWAQAMTGVRTPLGAMLKRETTAAKFSTSLPGAPDGEYIVFQFDSSFDNKQAATETVTAMKDLDGTWRVAGYFIR